MANKKKKKKFRGFTLIELLAVIVILGIIMLVAIPAVTGYISGARNDSYINDASLFVDGVKNLAITKNKLPFADGQVYFFKVAGEGGLQLESGGKQSPYGVKWDEYYTYVAIAKVNGNYVYAFAGNDEQGNFIPLSTLEYLRDSNIEVQNVGSKAGARRCIGGIAGAATGNIAKCVTDTEDFQTGNWDEDNLGNAVDLGFEALKPTGESTQESGLIPMYINGIMEDNGSGNRRMLYATRVFTNITGGADPGYRP